MRILMVTPYAPERDGIAAYALQSVRRLRADGHEVVVLSPRPSAAHLCADLHGWRGALALRRHSRGFDRVIVQYHPDIFFPVPAPPALRAQTAAALAAVWRSGPPVEVRVHETDYRWGRGPAWSALAVRSMWHAATLISVHTQRERHDFHDAYGVPLQRIQVTPHGGDFIRHTSADRVQARASLGVPPSDLVFLCIGFIQQHKGFDRAVEAFRTLAEAGGHGVRLDIVGAVRLEQPAQIAYANRLRRLIEETPGVELHAGFANDELFDRWIVAADVVILPYRNIWSSGVLERAALYGKPVIATRVGALSEQARPDTLLVGSDEELAAAMRQVATDRGIALDTQPIASIPAWPVDAGVSRASVMEEIRRRAAQEREHAGSAESDGRPRIADPQLTASLRRIPALRLPQPASSRPGVSRVKRLVRRLTAWELTPIVDQVNALQGALVDVVERLPAATGSLSGSPDEPDATSPRSLH